MGRKGVVVGLVGCAAVGVVSLFGGLAVVGAAGGVFWFVSASPPEPVSEFSLEVALDEEALPEVEDPLADEDADEGSEEAEEPEETTPSTTAAAAAGASTGGSTSAPRSPPRTTSTGGATARPAPPPPPPEPEPEPPPPPPDEEDIDQALQGFTFEDLDGDDEPRRRGRRRR